MNTDRKTKSRAALVGMTIVAVMMLLIGRLYYVQIIASDEIIAAHRRQFETRITEPPARGDIICLRNGLPVLLGTTVHMPALTANPRTVGDKENIAAQLAQILDRDRDEMLVLLSKIYQPDGRPNYHVNIADRLTQHQVGLIRALKCGALHLTDRPVRVYPRARLLSTVLGFAGRGDDGFQNRGLEGLERQYNKVLRGEGGLKVYAADASRKKITLLKERSTPSRKGGSIILTIDADIQQIAEEVLAGIFEKWQPESATAVVMDPHTGDILAMANVPDYDPNHYGAFMPDERRNRAITDTYEPGSTFKPIIASFVLEEGLATPETSFKCYGLVEGRAIGDHCSGWLTLREVIVKSSNRGAARMALLLNRCGKLQPGVRRFGFGEFTSIDFPGERAGAVTPGARWSKSTAGSVGFGHEIAVTPLQLIRAYCVIANGGKLVHPRLVSAIIGPDGKRTEIERDDPVTVLDAGVARAMLDILGDVVREGTGKAARIPEYEIGGKTGTAEKVINGVYSRSRHTSFFAGIGPLENPRLCVLICVNDPKGGTFGGTVAAPGVGEIFRRSLRLMQKVTVTNYSS